VNRKGDDLDGAELADVAAPRRPIAVNPPWRHERRRDSTSARAAPWRVLRFASPLPGDCDRPARRCWLPLNFGDKIGRWPLLSPKFTVAKRPSPRGGVKDREPQRRGRRFSLSSRWLATRSARP
jgi:hypothetical protein